MNDKVKNAPLLVADDDYIVRKLISHVFKQAGLPMEVYESGDDLLGAISEETLTCVLDLRMPGKDGMACLRHIKERHPDIEVIILTNINQATEAMEAIRCGAFDYMTKPFDPGEFIHTVRKAMDLARKQRENADLRHSFIDPDVQLDVLGDSQSMKEVHRLVRRMAPMDNPVLLTGESGTGKTLLARMIHGSSQRAEGPFISVSCPSLPGELLESEMFGHEKGAFSGAAERRLGRAELANGGTLFLDEIGDLPLALQPKLLTFIQEKSHYRVGGEKAISSDVRIIAATNTDLEQLVKEGRFREDLFFRLNVLPIEMPPLRERITDIPALTDHFVAAFAASAGGPVPKVDAEVYALLSHFGWPGNVRQLENAVVRSCTLRATPGKLCADDFSGLFQVHEDGHPYSAMGDNSLAGRALADIEKSAIRQTLDLCRGRKAEAARILGIAEKSIYNKMKRYGI
jgi:DNA-binding NtrC family response regulator